MANVAWIGLGPMGRPMATHLVAAGHKVRGVEISAANASCGPRGWDRGRRVTGRGRARHGRSPRSSTTSSPTRPGITWYFRTRVPLPNVEPSAPGWSNYEPGFTTELLSKDLTLAMIAGEDVYAPLAIAQTALRYSTRMSSQAPVSVTTAPCSWNSKRADRLP